MNMLSSLLTSLFVGLAWLTTAASGGCKCFPGDECWPSQDEWDSLNKTVDGRLVASMPLASPCHDPNYNEEECEALRAQWLYSGIHMEHPSSIMAPLFANQSCDPFTSREIPCTAGNYAAYTVNASNAEHVKSTVNFAQDRNLRLVIRNTGHDYLGRSTGAGALAIWTRHLKGTEVVDWSTNDYEGKALNLGAGVQGFEALGAARVAGLVVVTGECPTVGVAGGYLQGGGHSGLSTSFGLAADNALAFEVVTATGKLLQASQDENSDLYWALSGGGGGTFGVVTSVTVKAHPDAPVAGLKLAVGAPEEDPGRIFHVIDAWHDLLPSIVDTGIMVIYFFGDSFLQIPALTAYNRSTEDVRSALQPFLDSLSAMNIPIEPSITEFASYHDHYEHYWGPLPEGNIQVGTMLFGGRLIPRDVISTPAFSSASKKIAEMGVTFIGVGVDVSSFGRDSSNSVLQQWRDSLVQASLILPWSFEAPWEEMLAAQQKMTEQVQPIIESATPGAGAYMNEADFQQRDWQETFFGHNFDALRKIKTKYDPNNLLYAIATVGSEDWKVEEDGRLCRLTDKSGGPAEAHDEL